MSSLRDKLRKEGWLTVTEAVHTYNLSHSTIYRLVKTEVLPSRRVGGRRTPSSTGRGGGTVFVSKAALEQLTKV